MANSKSLVIQSGLIKQIPDADTLIVGVGIRSVSGSALTITSDTGNLTIASATDFTAAGTALAVTNNATVGGTLIVTGEIGANGGVGRSTSGTLLLGTDAQTTALTIGSSGVMTTIAGDLTVNGTETIVGTTVFDSTVTIGDGTGTDSLVFNSTSGRLGSSGLPDVKWIKEVNHQIYVDASTTASTAGGTLLEASGAGSAGSGGTAGGAGGSMTINSGAGGAGGTTAAGQNAGALVVQGGVGGVAGSTSGNGGIGGVLTIQGGTGGAAAAGTGTGGAGGSNAHVGGTGGAASTTGGGGIGGAATVTGGAGGVGASGQTAGNGGAVTITGGAGGAAGGGTQGNGGALTLDAGSGLSNGAISIGATNAASIGIGRSGITTTVTGGLSQLTGAVSLTANAASSFTTSSGALTITAAAASTWSTTAGALTLTSAAAATWSTAAGALTITSAAAATWSTAAGALTLNGASDINLQSGGATSIVISSAGAVVQAGKILSTTGSGNINLPNNGSARFQIEGSAVGSTVTAANLDTLTNGSNADALHTHAAATATSIAVSGTAGENINVGELVVFDDSSGNPRVFKADANGAGELVNAVGIAFSTVTSGNPIDVIVCGERSVADSEFDSVPGTSDVGKKVFMSETAGNYTLTATTTAGSTVQKVAIVSRGGSGNVKLIVQIGEGVLL